MSCECKDGDFCVEMINGRKKRIITLVELDSDKIREHDDFFRKKLQRDWYSTSSYSDRA